VRLRAGLSVRAGDRAILNIEFCLRLRVLAHEWRRRFGCLGSGSPARRGLQWMLDERGKLLPIVSDNFTVLERPTITRLPGTYCLGETGTRSIG
jgi:hypothetical protein